MAKLFSSNDGLTVIIRSDIRLAKGLYLGTMGICCVASVFLMVTLYPLEIQSLPTPLFILFFIASGGMEAAGISFLQALFRTALSTQELSCRDGRFVSRHRILFVPTHSTSHAIPESHNIWVDDESYYVGGIRHDRYVVLFDTGGKTASLIREDLTYAEAEVILQWMLGHARTHAPAGLPGTRVNPHLAE